MGCPFYAMAKDDPPAVDEDIAFVQDPFDMQTRAPALFEFFLKGLKEIQNKITGTEPKPGEVTPVKPVVKPVVVPKPPEPVKPKKPDVPR